jgi:hypothetical protein
MPLWISPPPICPGTDHLGTQIFVSPPISFSGTAPKVYVRAVGGTCEASVLRLGPISLKFEASIE